MQLSTQCSIAVHCLIFIHEASETARVTSTLLAKSTGCNPAMVRRILSALHKAGLISVARGTGGAALRLPPEQITLYRIYAALEPDGLRMPIGIHHCEGRSCPVARSIGAVLEEPYRRISDAIQHAMEQITLLQLIERYQSIQKNGN